MDLFEKCMRRSMADEAQDLGIYPYFHAPQSRQDVVVQMEGKRGIMLGSNNYLDLTTGPHMICDRESHASIYDSYRLSFGKTLRYRRNGMSDLKEKLRRVPENSGRLIVTGGVFSMGGNLANLPEIVRLARRHGARVYTPLPDQPEIAVCFA